MAIANEQVRQRALAAYKAGQGTQAQVAQFYRVNLTTFQRWLRRYRTTGRAAPLPRGHNPAALDDTQMRQLDELVQATPDATLKQLRAALGLGCSLVAIHQALQRLGYHYKKNAAGQRTRTARHQSAT